MSHHLVFIHGNSLSARGWNALLATPALQHIPTWAMDLPGHGSAPRLPADRRYDLETFAEAVSAGIQAHPQVVLVGHSLGGHIAARVAARNPNVRGVLLFGAPLLRHAGDVARAYIPVPALAKAYTAQLERRDAEELAEAFTWPGAPVVAEVADDILRTDPRVRSDLGAVLSGGTLPDEVALLQGSAAAVRVVHGADDPFIRTDYLHGLAQELQAGPVLLVPKAGHSPQLQRPDALAAHISDFVHTLDRHGTRS